MAGFADTIFNWVPKLRKPDLTLADATCDAGGAQKVAVVATVTAVTTWIDPQIGTPLTYNRVVAALPKKLHQIVGSNDGAADRWFMVFDRTTLATNGAEPVFAFKVNAGNAFALDLPRPRAFAAGVAWAVSSTAGTLTLDTGATFRVNLEVES